MNIILFNMLIFLILFSENILLSIANKRFPKSLAAYILRKIDNFTYWLMITALIVNIFLYENAYYSKELSNYIMNLL